MTPMLNRWTGQPHTHAGERARRARQHRSRQLVELALAEMARAQVEHLFPDLDRASMARKLGALREQLRQKETERWPPAMV